MKPLEYISSDILEESHLKSFAPFRSIQMILGSCRVDAKHRFVTAPTKAQKMYTITYLLIILSLYTNLFLNHFTKFFEHRNVYYLSLLILFFHYGIFACNVIHVRFINNDLNVKFYIKMQDIDRKLKIEKNSFLNDLLFKTNIVTVVFVFLILLILFVTNVTEDLIIFLCFLGPLFAQLTNTLEWLYCTNLLLYFYLRIRYINAIMINYTKGTEHIKVDKVKNNKLPTMEVLRCLAADTHNFQSSDCDVYLRSIFEELYRFQCLYRFQVFLFCLKFVTYTLMTFEFGLLGLQYNILEWFEYILLPTLIAIDFIIILVISIRCEAFFREVKTTKHLCIKVLSFVYSGPIRQKAIKMLKIIQEKPPQFSVYDMWHMETSTMISMINLVTTIMVTLLQFALL